MRVRRLLLVLVASVLVLALFSCGRSTGGTFSRPTGPYYPDIAKP